LARGTALRFLQLLINKFGASTENIGYSDRNVHVLLPILPDKPLDDSDHVAPDTVVDIIKALVVHSCKKEQPAIPECHQERVYQTLSYAAAAALARCDKSDQDLIDLMIKGISDPIHGSKVARSFRTLLAPSPFLTKENFCVIRPLRNGRLYNFSVDKLRAMWRDNPADLQLKSNVLVALAGILVFMDPAVYLDHGAAILPVLLEGTNISNDDGSKLACIVIIRKIIPSHPILITSHLDSVISRMTDRTHNTYYSPSDANVETRSAAIEVLGLLTKYIDTAELLKRKAKVIKELEVAVDDISSVVRQKATACKLKWFNLGEA
jgi:DNA repair/transcription protein MET18/MMS19